MSNGLRWSQERLDEARRRIDTAMVKAWPKVSPCVPNQAAQAELNHHSEQLLEKVPLVKKPKYRNAVTADEDGTIHASKKQAKRWKDLRTMFRGGAVAILGREISFRLPGGVEYRADHVYFLPEALPVLADLIARGLMTVEDVKSPATAKDSTYRLKARQMRECLGMVVQEV